MPAVIDATEAGVASNSYATLPEADAYHEEYVGDADQSLWASLDVDVRNRALITATRQFEAYVRWYGNAQTNTQKLGFPRLGLVYPQTAQVVVGIPLELKWAVSEQARIIAAADRALDNATDTQGIRRIKADTVELEFQPLPTGATVRQSAIAPSAWQFVAGWGSLIQPGMSGTVPLARV